jgi:glycosyltransferase involved in cell wall biosynthesis
MQRLEKVEPPVHLLILGSGREEARLREQIHEAGLEDRISLGGFRNEVPRYLAGADLVVNPSLTEGMPNVLLEALSVGIAIVATDVGGTRELIVPMKTGRLVPPHDPESLACAITSALDRPEQSREWAENGRRFVTETLSFARQSEQLASLLTEATSCHRGVAGGRDQ